MFIRPLKKEVFTKAKCQMSMFWIYQPKEAGAWVVAKEIIPS